MNLSIISIILLSSIILYMNGIITPSNIITRGFIYSYNALKDFLYGGGVEGESIGIRLQLIRNGINALIESCGLGVGGGGSVAVQESVGGVEVTSMHNFWIEVLVDSGILFALIFYMWYVYLVFILYKIRTVTKNKYLKYYASATSLSMLGFIVGAISASTVIYLLPMWILFGFAIAVVNNYKRMKWTDFKDENIAFTSGTG